MNRLSAEHYAEKYGDRGELPIPELTETEAADFPLPRRVPHSHKYSYGRALVIAGSRGYSGAPVLAANACERSGAGLTQLLVPESLYPIAAAGCDGAVVTPLPAAESGGVSLAALPAVLERLGKAQACVIGPGLGAGEESRALVHAVLGEARCPLILDADALNACAGEPALLDGCRTPLILTPHEGEFKRLGGDLSRGRLAGALAFTQLHPGLVLVLKGYGTLCCRGTTCSVNPTGGPAMAKGGAGDVRLPLRTAGPGLRCLVCGPLRRLAARPRGRSGRGGAGRILPRPVGSDPLFARRVPGTDRRENKTMKLNPQNMEWTRAPKYYTVTEDAVTIRTEPFTDLWQRTYYHFRNNNAPALQLTSEEKFFSFVVKTEFDTHVRYDQSGVILYLDSDNWLKAAMEYENEKIQRLGSVVTNHGYSDWASVDVDAAIKSAWFRLSRREDDFCIEYSPDGEDFRQMRICHLFEAAGPIRFGIYACSAENSSFTARFSHMELTECRWLAHDGQQPDDQ